MKKDPTLEFKINTPAFLKEIFDNNPKLGGVFRVPANILRTYLLQIAQRAAELNDPKLNAIMCQMSLYEIADQYAPGFNQAQTNEIISKKYSA